ncbi:MAG: substrate-binding domain-containing protein [Beijerinckiaceae bacterium]|nr:substrate-binding domain-containing protein [Beijerinckiaceae bacterium]
MGLIAPLRVLSAGSTVRALRALAPVCESRIGRALEIATDHGHNILARIRAGEDVADVLLLPAPMLDELAALGALAMRRLALGEVATSAVVCAGAPAPAPGVETMDGLRAGLSKASVVLLTTAPSGEHMMSVIERLGLADEVASKLMRFDKSAQINEWLANARDLHALGFGPTTEIVGVTGVADGGLIAREAQMSLPYEAALTKTAADFAAGTAFLEFLSGDEARAAFVATGMSV